MNSCCLFVSHFHLWMKRCKNQGSFRGNSISSSLYDVRYDKRQDDERDCQYRRQTGQEQVKSARLLFAKQMLGTTGNRTGQSGTLALLQQNDCDQSQGHDDQKHVKQDAHLPHLQCRYRTCTYICTDNKSILSYWGTIGNRAAPSGYRNRWTCTVPRAWPMISIGTVAVFSTPFA